MRRVLSISTKICIDSERVTIAKRNAVSGLLVFPTNPALSLKQKKTKLFQNSSIRERKIINLNPHFFNLNTPIPEIINESDKNTLIVTNSIKIIAYRFLNTSMALFL
jgi:hypothetical protein